MRDFRTAMISRASELYKKIIGPILIIGIIAAIGLLFFLYNKEKEILSLKMELYVEELKNIFEEIESKYNPVISKVFQSEYDQKADANSASEPFQDDFMKKFRATIKDVNFDKLDIELINYYRINEQGIVYESDYAKDIGLDLSVFDSFWEQLQGLEQGEIFLSVLDDEVITGALRLYSYIKLRDDRIFETGIKFKGLEGYILQTGRRIFGNKFDQLTIHKSADDFIWGNPSLDNSDFDHLESSLRNDEVVLVHKNLVRSTLYYGIITDYGSYNLILDTVFYYSFIAIGLLVMLVSLGWFHYLKLRKHIGTLAEKITKPIIVLDNNIRNFRLSKNNTEPYQIATDILEIDSISQNFNAMRDEIKDSYSELEAINEELEESYCENQRLLNRLDEFMSVPDYLLYVDNTKEFLIRCFRKICGILHDIDYGLVSLIENGRLNFIDAKGYDMDRLNRMNIDAQNFMKHKTITLNQYKKGEFALKFKEREQQFEDFQDSVKDISQSLILPVISKNKYYGHLTFYTTDKGRQLTDDDYKTVRYFLNFVQGFLMIHELAELENDIQRETVYSMIRLLEKHDPYTKGHSENVAVLASEFTEFLGMDSKEVKNIYWAGIIHDLGKILIPHNILNKPSRLTLEEYELIKKHPSYVFDVFSDSITMKEIALYVKYHHEKYNGKGYPEGLKGDAIPFQSRILALADAWDAMTGERVYKKGLNYEEAIYEITKNAGVQFDPDLVKKWMLFILNEKKRNPGDDFEYPG